MQHLHLLFISAIVLSGCGDTWIGADDEKPLPGKRISVLAHRAALRADPMQDKIIIELPEEEANESWQLQGVAPVERPFFPALPKKQDSLQAGQRPQEGLRLTSAPIVAEGIIFI